MEIKNVHGIGISIFPSYFGFLCRVEERKFLKWEAVNIIQLIILFLFVIMVSILPAAMWTIICHTRSFEFLKSSERGTFWKGSTMLQCAMVLWLIEDNSSVLWNCIDLSLEGPKSFCSLHTSCVFLTGVSNSWRAVAWWHEECLSAASFSSNMNVLQIM